MRHDAARNRQDVKSERIRLSLGLLTPEERQDLANREEARRLAAQKKAQAGTPLDLEED